MRTDMTRTDQGDGPGRRERRATRLRVRRIDALSAQLAQLHGIRAVLERATEIVLRGWIQGAWFAVDVDGRSGVLTAPQIRLTDDHPVTGACLVGAVVQAGGGAAAVRSQPVQRALDLTWHSLREDTRQPVRWYPGLPVRTMHVLDLTHWNDAPGQTRGDVVDLLRSSVAMADAQLERCRSEQAVLAGDLARTDGDDLPAATSQPPSYFPGPRGGARGPERSAEESSVVAEPFPAGRDSEPICSFS